jgi:hypothetical protein
MFSAATEAWDRQQLSHATSTRTVSIPTHEIGTTDFGLTPADADSLYAWGLNAAHDFFTAPAQEDYINSFGKTLEPPPVTNGTTPPAQAAVADGAAKLK